MKPCHGYVPNCWRYNFERTAPTECRGCCLHASRCTRPVGRVRSALRPSCATIASTPTSSTTVTWMSATVVRNTSASSTWNTSSTSRRRTAARRRSHATRWDVYSAYCVRTQSARSQVCTDWRLSSGPVVVRTGAVPPMASGGVTGRHALVSWRPVHPRIAEPAACGHGVSALWSSTRSL